MTIKELRTKANMTQKEFSEYFGVPKRSIENWESESRKCPDYLVDLIEYKLLKERITMQTTWSVEVAPYYNDDTFLGTYEECVEYIKEQEYPNDVDYQISEIDLDENGCFNYCYNTIKKEDIQ